MFFALITRCTARDPLDPAVIIGITVCGFVNELLTKVITFRELSRVSVDALVTAVEATGDEMEGEEVVNVEGGVVRETTGLMEPFNNVDIFVESMFKIFFESSDRGGSSSSCLTVGLLDDDDDDDDTMEILSSFSTLTMGFDKAEVAAFNGVIMLPDFTGFVMFIFTPPPKVGTELVLMETGTCFKLAFVGSLPADKGLNA